MIVPSKIFTRDENEKILEENRKLKDKIEVMEAMQLEMAAFDNPADAWENVKALEEKVDRLKAHVELLRKVLRNIAKDDWEDVELNAAEYANSVLHETPAQSLNHIKAQVEEETIEADAVLAEETVETEVWGFGHYDKVHGEKSASAIRSRPRKYKEQPDACDNHI